MPEKITLLGKTFGIYCPTHPKEFHDTIQFRKINDENAEIYLKIRFDTNEQSYYFWAIPINALLEFEKNLDESGISSLEDGDKFLAIMLKNGKLFYKIKIVNRIPDNASYISDLNNWRELKEK